MTTPRKLVEYTNKTNMTIFKIFYLYMNGLISRGTIRNDNICQTVPAIPSANMSVEVPFENSESLLRGMASCFSAV